MKFTPRALVLRLKRCISQECMFLGILLQQSLSNWWLLKLFYLLSMRIKLPHRVTSLTFWRGDIGYTPRGGGGVDERWLNLQLAITHFIIIWAIKGCLSKSPAIPVFSWKSPDKTLWLVSFQIHTQISNVRSVHMIPELQTDCLIGFHPAA